MSLTPDDQQRLDALKRFLVLDAPREDGLARIARVAAQLYGVPYAVISLRDGDGETAAAAFGVDVADLPAEATLFARPAGPALPVVVPDAAADARLAQNPLVHGPQAARFYAGVPLKSREGFTMGTLAILDTTVHDLNGEGLAMLTDLGACVEPEVELRRLERDGGGGKAPPTPPAEIEAATARAEAAEARLAELEARLAELEARAAEADAHAAALTEAETRQQEADAQRQRAAAQLEKAAQRLAALTDQHAAAEARAAEATAKAADADARAAEATAKTADAEALLAALTAERDALRGEAETRTALAADADDLATRLAETERRAADAEARATEAETRAAEAREAAARTAAERDAAETQRAEIEARLADLDARLTDAASLGDDAQTRIQDAEARAAEAERRAAEAEQRATDAAARLAALDEEATAKDQDVEARIAEADARIAEADARVHDAAERIQQAADLAAAAAARASEAEAHAAELQAQADELQTQADEVQARLDEATARAADATRQATESGERVMALEATAAELESRAAEHRARADELEARLAEADARAADAERRAADAAAGAPDAALAARADEALARSRRAEALLAASAFLADAVMRGESDRFGEALARLGEAAAAARLALYLHTDVETALCFATWQAPDAAPLAAPGDALRYGAVGLERWGTAFAAGQAVYGPPGAFPAVEAGYLRQRGVTHFAGLPLVADGEGVGFVALDAAADEGWTDAERDALRAAFSLLAAGLRRGRAGAGALALAHDCAAPLLIVSDAEGTVAYANPAALLLLGVDVAEAALPLLSYAAAADRGPLAMALAAAERAPADPVDLALTDAEGHEHAVRALAGPTRYDGRPAVLVALVDTTALHAAQGALLADRDRAETEARVKGALLATLSHEVRAALSSLLSYADVLADELDGVHRDTAEMMRLSGQRLLQAMEAALDLARLETADAPPRMTALDVGPLVQAAAEPFAALAAARDLAFIVKPAPEGTRAIGDAAAVARVLDHLLANAFRATERGGVRLRVSADPEWVCVEVQDTGAGLDADAVPDLLDDTAAPGTARPRGGAAFSLAITKRLVELMGGELTAQSVPGQGSVFRVLLRTPLDDLPAPGFGAATFVARPAKRGANDADGAPGKDTPGDEAGFEGDGGGRGRSLPRP